MKIYILPITAELQPSKQPFLYPSHNDDYGVEQDFLIWLKKNPRYLTNNPSESDWHYLPVYWTRWHLNHDFGNDEKILAIIKKNVDNIIIDDHKTFTIVQYDDGPKINLGNSVQFLASPQNDTGIAIPLLCKKHKLPLFNKKKCFLANFSGSFETHSIRKELYSALTINNDVSLEPGSIGKPFLHRVLTGNSFVEGIISSYIGLAPRGYGGSSFRFFEIMQLGTAPCHIGNRDVRPFKKFIDWDSMSYYTENITDLTNLLKNFDKKIALKKGKDAKAFFDKELYYQKWCKFVIMELSMLK